MLFAALLAASFADRVLTVDDDGPAAFADLSAAIAAASAGDVLVIEPGVYAPFVLDKPLTLVGRASADARPRVLGESRVVASAFTLAGLELFELAVRDVRGRGSIDGCAIGHAEKLGVGGAATFRIEGCAEIVVTRTLGLGHSGDELEAESPGLEIARSRVVLVGCRFEGGAGADGGFDGFSGRPGLVIEQGSDVLLVASSARGGDGGEAELPLFGCASDGAPAILVTGSSLVVRGSAGDVLASGHPCGAGRASPAIAGLAASVRVSGVELAQRDVAPVLRASLPEPAEPFLALVEQGPERRLELHGPPGAQALVIASFAPALLDVEGIAGGALWLDPLRPFQLALVQTSGHDAGVELVWRQPASVGLVGRALVVQAFFPGLAGASAFATNPDELVLRP